MFASCKVTFEWLKIGTFKYGCFAYNLMEVRLYHTDKGVYATDDKNKILADPSGFNPGENFFLSPDIQQPISAKPRSDGQVFSLGDRVFSFSGARCYDWGENSFSTV